MNLVTNRMISDNKSSLNPQNTSLPSFDLLWYFSIIPHVLMLCSFWNFIWIPDVPTSSTTGLRDDCEEKEDKAETGAHFPP